MHVAGSSDFVLVLGGGAPQPAETPTIAMITSAEIQERATIPVWRAGSSTFIARIAALRDSS